MRKALHVVVFVIILGFLLALVPPVRQIVKKVWDRVATITQQNLSRLKSSAVGSGESAWDQNLIYYWDFDSGHYTTGNGAVVYSQKQQGDLAIRQSPGMNTSDGYQGQGIVLNHNYLIAYFAFPSSFDYNNSTFDMWVKIAAGKKITLQLRGAQSHGIDVWGEIRTDFIVLNKYTGQTTPLKTSYGVTPNQWTRVSYVFQGVGNSQTKYSIFIDGKHAGSMTTNSIDSGGFLILGKDSWDDTEGPSEGLIDEFKIYQQAYLKCGNGIVEGAEQCDAAANNGKGGSTCSLQCEKVSTAYPAFESSIVHYFPFEESSWNSTFDTVGGKKYNFGASTGESIGFTESGKKGRALSPSGGYAVPYSFGDDPINVTRNKWTMDFWVKLKNVGAPAYYSMKIFGQPDFSYDSVYFRMTTNAFVLSTSSFNRNWYDYNIPLNLAEDTWHRISIVANPTSTTNGGTGNAKYRLYVNGQGFPESEEVAIFQYYNNNLDYGDPKKSLRFGKGGGGTSANAEIDEFKIYNTALTESDIAAFAWCGNGVIEAPKEECDDAANNGTTGSMCSLQCINQTSQEDPMGYWKFDEGSGVVSKSASGFDLNLKNGAAFDNGQTNLGKALKLDGVDDMASLSSGRFMQGKAITIEAWIRAEDDQKKQHIVRMRSVNSTPGFNLFLESNNLYFAINAAQGALMAATGNDGIVAGNWYFVAVTYDASGEAIIYLNGARKGAAAARGQIVYPPDGKDFDLGVQFKGNLDEVAFYNRARSSAEISAQYNAMKQVIADTLPPKNLIQDLMAYWKMDEAPGSSTITDFSGNDLTGKEDSATAQALPFVPGKLGFGSALSLTGQTIRVTPTVKLLTPDRGKNLTISFWIKSAQPGGTVLEKKAQRKADRSEFVLINNNVYRVAFSNSKTMWDAGDTGDTTNMLYSTTPIADPNWHLITVTIAEIPGSTSLSLKTYRDGTPDGTGVTLSIEDSQLVDLFIGNGLNGPFKGLLDDLRIYKRALSNAEILALYSALPPKDMCGNGVPNTREQCDDGNADNTDACTDQCLNAVCGDGVKRTGVEECDLGKDPVTGNLLNSDTGACTLSCKNAFCGDSKTQAGVELCDDGNTVDTDACVACQNAKCGDQKIQTGVEQCDDGNADATDACNVCQNTFCGDGVIQLSFDEECDDGNTVGGDGCTEFCVKEAICGNGKIETGAVCTARDAAGKCTVYNQITEECDPPGATCTAVCKNAPPPSQGGWNWAK